MFAAPRRQVVLVLAAAALVLIASPGSAEEPAAATPDIQKLLERLDKLEQRNEELEKTVRQLKEQQTESPTSQEKPAGPDGDKKDVDKVQLDENAVRKIVSEYLEQSAAKTAEQAKSGDGQPSRYTVGKNLNFTASWKDGVWFETADKAFNFHVGGRIDFDTVWYSAPHSVVNSIGQFNNYLDPNLGLQDGFDIRRFRLRVDGTMWEQFDYRVEVDFANALDLRRRTLGITPAPPSTGTIFDQNLAPPVRMTDVYMEYRDLPYIGTIRAGHQREILTFANGSSDNFQPFMERPMIFAAFNNDFQFDDGITVYRTYLCDRLYSWMGLFRPSDFNTGDDLNGGFNLGDGKYAFDARLTALPVWMDKGREWLLLGAAYSYRKLPQNNQTRFAANPEEQSAASSFLVPKIINTGTLLSNRGEQIFNLEAASAWGPLTLTAEYSAANLTNVYTSSGGTNPLFVPSPNATPAQLAALGLTKRGSYFAQGYYVEALYLLTGEHRPLRLNQPAYDRLPVEEKAFWVPGSHGSLFGSGAWEIGVRYDYLDLSQHGINGGFAHAVTGGINWYLNENMKIQWNYTWMNRNFEPTNTAGLQEGDFEGFGMRFHVDF
jgi:phosphate-selective porin OprO/OprP